ncbi:glycosyltransferase family 8 protein [Lentisphaerota bacterium WC36G]|nr:glycosyltransferase family 8 protein [Lentisphaerae bacterium WC36]
MSKEIIPICFTFDDNYVNPALVAFYSMLENADQKYFYKIYVLQAKNNISEFSKEKLTNIVKLFNNAELEFKKVNFDIDLEWDGVFSAHFSPEILIKLILPSIFNNYDKIIVSDVDVVFTGDISKSFTNYNLDNYYIAGVRSLEKLNDFYAAQSYSDEVKEKLFGSIGAGYMIYNLNAMRENNLEDLFLDNLKRYRKIITQPEQDIINISIDKDKILYLPLKYMFCTYMYRLIKKEKLDLSCSGKWIYYFAKKWLKKIKEDKYNTKNEILEAFISPVQIHYATGIKPWNVLFCYKKFIWLKYFSKVKKEG